MPLNPALLEQVTCEYIVHRPILVVKKKPGDLPHTLPRSTKKIPFGYSPRGNRTLKHDTFYSKHWEKRGTPCLPQLHDI